MTRRKALEGALVTGAGLGALAAIPFRGARAEAEVPPVLPARSVRDFGARGDGIADDTQAVQSAIDAALENDGGEIHFPSGNYRLTRTLRVTKVARLDFTGAGWSSTLLHDSDEHLLLWPENVSCRECSVRNLRVLASGKDKSRGTAVIACLGGIERTFFDHLLFYGDASSRMGSGILTRKLADSVALDHCQMWNVMGVGLEIAPGSDIRMIGGRIIGASSLKEGNVGILLAGENGGVHVVTPDIIGLHTGMQIGVPGGKSNREIIITHPTFDSCVYGVRQFDSSYTSIAGCWAASCDEAQIQVEASGAGAVLSVCGGTIFNGGAYKREGAKNGLVVRAGSFTLSGVNVRNNAGTGLLVEGKNVGDYAVSGCRFHGNGVGMSLQNGTRSVVGNVFTGNKTDVIANRRGKNPFTANKLRG